jgi:trehalose 6-phosphate phosphatase
MRAATCVLFRDVAEHYPCAVVSGRAQADLLKRLRGIRIAETIGNHGLEPWQWSDHFWVQVRRWLPDLQRELEGLEGVSIEDKVFSLAIHYRASKSKRKVRAAIARTVGRLDGVRVVGGKQVMNLLPEGAPHKGIALQKAQARLGRDTVIYVGDDETDEDVFALDACEILTIRVGYKRTSRAAYFIRDQRRIDALLRHLRAFRAERCGAITSDPSVPSST